MGELSVCVRARTCVLCVCVLGGVGCGRKEVTRENRKDFVLDWTWVQVVVCVCVLGGGGVGCSRKEVTWMFPDCLAKTTKWIMVPFIEVCDI